VAQLAPLVHLRDVFGSFDIEEIERMPETEQLRRQFAFSKSRGFDRSMAATPVGTILAR